MIFIYNFVFFTTLKVYNFFFRFQKIKSSHFFFRGGIFLERKGHPLSTHARYNASESFFSHFLGRFEIVYLERGKGTQ